MRSAEVIAKTGTIRVDGWPVDIARGLRQKDAEKLVSSGELKVVEGIIPSGNLYETPLLELGGKKVKLSLYFENGVLDHVGIGIEKLEWWTRKGHAQNVALRERLFGKRRKFDGGRIETKFTTKTGALTDGGTTFYLLYSRE